jgi:hypothetical protein
VYEGSLVVNYEIAPTEEEPLQMEELQARQNEKFATGQVDTGAPILDVAVRKPPSIIAKEKEENGGKEVEEEPVSLISDGKVTAPGFAPITITATASNTLDRLLWPIVEILTIETPAQIFKALMKETMQFVLGKRFKKEYVKNMAAADPMGSNAENPGMIDL